MEQEAITPAPHPMTRRKFLGTLTGIFAAGLAVQVLGCTTDADLGTASPGTDPNACPAPGGQAKLAATDRTGTISSNHGHTAVVTTAVQDAGVAHNLSIAGSAGHDHILALTMTDIDNLKAGAQLVKTSSTTNSHAHTVTFAMVTAILRPC
jgi:hypothetical protein